MQLSEKPKTFCQFSIAFLESTSNFEHFETKSEPYSLSIFEVTYSERRAYLNAWKVLFLKTFGSERVNESQKLLKSAEKYFYPTFSSSWAKLSWKNSFLVRWEILGLLVNESQKLLKSVEKYFYPTFSSSWAKLN